MRGVRKRLSVHFEEPRGSLDRISRALAVLKSLELWRLVMVLVSGLTTLIGMILLYDSFASNQGNALVLLRHRFLRCESVRIGVAQHGHRDSLLTRSTINLFRMVAIEFGTWRCVRSGGASGSVTVGNGKFLEQRGATRS